MERVILVASLCVVTLSGIVASPVRAAPSSETTIALTHAPEMTPDVALQLRRSVESALVEVAQAQTGAQAAHGPLKPKWLRENCGNQSCVRQIAEATSADYVLTMQGFYRHQTFDLQIQLWRADGTRLRAERQSCRICTLADFGKTIQDTTQSLFAQGLTSQPHGQGDATEKSSPVTPHDKDPPSLWRQPLPLAGMALMVVGAATMAYGGYLVSVDGDATCIGDPCFETRIRQSATAGWTRLGIGTTLALTGGGLFLFGKADGPSPSVSLAITPGYWGIHGRF